MMVRGVVATLSMLLARGIRHGLRTDNPALRFGLRFAVNEKPEPDPFDRADAELLLNTARTPIGVGPPLSLPDC
jgi:hypothetical protein